MDMNRTLESNTDLSERELACQHNPEVTATAATAAMMTSLVDTARTLTDSDPLDPAGLSRATVAWHARAPGARDCRLARASPARGDTAALLRRESGRLPSVGGRQ